MADKSEKESAKFRNTPSGITVAVSNSAGGNILSQVANQASAPTYYKNAGAATKANIKATAGGVVSILVTNTYAAVRYLQLHNKATAPAAADIAQVSIPIPAGTTTQPAYVELSSPWFGAQEYFTTGIGFAISTTDTTFTDLATASDHTVHIRYV